jgi:hypothetical protein
MASCEESRGRRKGFAQAPGGKGSSFPVLLDLVRRITEPLSPAPASFQGGAFLMGSDKW